jgi:hypothetical protein
VTSLIRRVLWTAAVVAVLALAAVFLIRGMTHSTIAFGEKCGAGNCWGYRLEQYRVSDQAVLTITGSWGMQLQYELRKMLVERVSEDRWLAGDRAIYLNFRLKPVDDPGSAGAPLRLIYDFQQGQMYINCPLQLWRAPDYQNGDAAKNWLTETEFQSVLTRIEP